MDTSEYIDIVNDNNKVIGVATLEEMYVKKYNHRIVHIFVLHPEEKKIYFQKRADTKSFLPGYYCSSAGGHVKSGESYTEAAQRELYEELGLKTKLNPVHSFIFISNGHKRFITLFTTYAKKGFVFQDGEVASGKFFSIDTAKRLVDKAEKIHPQLNLCFQWFYKNRVSFML